MEFKEQVDFITEYFPIASAQAKTDHIRIALSVQAMVVALNLNDGDMIVSARNLFNITGISTVTRGMKYASDVLGVIDSGRGRRTYVAEGGRDRARQGLLAQVTDIDLRCAVKRAKILSLDKGGLLELLDEQWEQIDDQ
jgi:DNA-binding transcriptional regulator YhcF (GntR family)